MREEATSDFWVLWTVETWRWLKPCAVRLTPTQRELSLRLTMPRKEGNKVNKPHRQAADTGDPGDILATKGVRPCC